MEWGKRSWICCGRSRFRKSWALSSSERAKIAFEAVSENTSREVYSLGHFKLHASDLLREIRASGQPLWLTVNGKGKVVIQDAASYQMLNQVDELQSLIGIRRGLAEVAAGR